MISLSPTQRRYLRFRSVTDRIGAAVLLAVLSPFMIGTAIGVRVTMGSPVTFSQTRIGRYGKPFKIFKFRSMVPEAEKLGQGYMPTELDLVPPFGKFIRRSSLDELPQLFNILRGEMSFIGPRPALESQYARYTAEQRQRVMVPQGVTGLAQVRYRNNAPWSSRIAVDIEYIETVGLRADTRILFATVGKIVRSDDVLLGQSAGEVDDLGHTHIDIDRG